MPAVTRLRRSERRALIKDALIDAAAEVFARKGYASATVAEIAAEAGYTVGALYSNFSSKRELFAEVFERQTDKQLAMAAELNQPGLQLVDLARRLLDQDEPARQAWLLWLEFVIDGQRNPTDAFPLRDLEGRTRSSIANLLRPQIPSLDDNLTLATAVQALWRGWLLGSATQGKAGPEAFARSIEWLIVGALAATPATTTTAHRHHRN